MKTFVLCFALVAIGCGGDDTTSGGGTGADMRAGGGADMASVCGHPGDTGNSLGVGKYCTKLTDCTSNPKATLCSVLGSDNAFFCTMTCTPAANDMGSTECGENAICQCGSGSGQSGCGCFPTACL
jgi:hypothetical protein